jgi:hypothetical protein
MNCSVSLLFSLWLTGIEERFGIELLFDGVLRSGYIDHHQRPDPDDDHRDQYQENPRQWMLKSGTPVLHYSLFPITDE